MSNNGNVLISGASFAGLAMAFWMKQAGYDVTMVEIASGLKKGGTPVNITGDAVDIVRRMGVLDQIVAHRLHMGAIEFKNADDITEHTHWTRDERDDPEALEYEIERDTLLDILFAAVKNNVAIMFGNRITALHEDGDGVRASFHHGPDQSFDLVLGCDGVHSAVRTMWFGDEQRYAYFLGGYAATTIVNTLLIRENTTQLYNEPGKAVMLNAYHGKTDIVLSFATDREIPYDYHDEAEMRSIVIDRFSGVGWRIPELLPAVVRSDTFYFDKLGQIRMPSWTKGRVALVGDAGYCASPAAGMGGSLALHGAAALADAFRASGGDHALAFDEYNRRFRPFVDAVQEHAEDFARTFFLPATDAAIRERNIFAG